MTYHSKTTLIHSLLNLAVLWAGDRSKDPSTKVGACIYDNSTGGVFLGYNGFPKGIVDQKIIWDNRTDDSMLKKYDLVVHAERNAVLKALKAGVDMSHATLVCTHIPCPGCMRDVIAANAIPEVFYLHPTFNSFSERDRTVVIAIAAAMNIRLEQIKDNAHV